MRKRTMWLARSMGDDEAYLLPKKPKRTKVEAVEDTTERCGGRGACTYGPDRDYILSGQPGRPAGFVYDTSSSVYSFCLGGLEEAGIALNPGQLVKVTLEPVR